MIKLIVGNKGSGKTKTLVKLANEAARVSKGNVVCVEKGMKMVGSLNVAVKLVDFDDYAIAGYEEFYGFLVGMLAGNYDTTHLFVDGTLKICGKDFEQFAQLAQKMNGLVKDDVTVVFTVSCDITDLPESMKQYII